MPRDLAVQVARGEHVRIPVPVQVGGVDREGIVGARRDDLLWTKRLGRRDRGQGHGADAGQRGLQQARRSQAGWRIGGREHKRHTLSVAPGPAPAARGASSGPSSTHEPGPSPMERLGSALPSSPDSVSGQSPPPSRFAQGRWRPPAIAAPCWIDANRTPLATTNGCGSHPAGGFPDPPGEGRAVHRRRSLEPRGLGTKMAIVRLNGASYRLNGARARGDRIEPPA